MLDKKFNIDKETPLLFLSLQKLIKLSSESTTRVFLYLNYTQWLIWGMAYYGLSKVWQLKAGVRLPGFESWLYYLLCDFEQVI